MNYYYYSEAENEAREIHNSRDWERSQLCRDTHTRCLKEGLTPQEADAEARRVNEEFIAETKRLTAHLQPQIEKDRNTILIAESKIVRGFNGDYESMWTIPLIKRYLRKYSKGAGPTEFGRAKNRYTANDIARAMKECLATEPKRSNGS